LFINASDEYVQHPQLRRLNDLSEENISRIVDVYENFKGIEGFSRVVDIDEIRTPNDYNLNVTLYVHPKIEVEDVDILSTWNKIKDLSLMNSRISEEIEEYLTDIGYVKSTKEGE